MIKIIKDLFKKADKLKRDSDGYVIANRQGVDVKPNEPFDCVSPAFRFDTEYEVKLANDKLKSQK